MANNNHFHHGLPFRPSRPSVSSMEDIAPTSAEHEPQSYLKDFERGYIRPPGVPKDKDYGPIAFQEDKLLPILDLKSFCELLDHLDHLANDIGSAVMKARVHWVHDQSDTARKVVAHWSSYFTLLDTIHDRISREPLNDLGADEATSWEERRECLRRRTAEAAEQRIRSRMRSLYPRHTCGCFVPNMSIPADVVRAQGEFLDMTLGRRDPKTFIGCVTYMGRGSSRGSGLPKSCECS